MRAFGPALLLASTLCASLLLGCGGRTDLLDVPPPSPSACAAVAYAACTPVGPSGQVITGADNPSLAFTGQVLLLGHQSYSTGAGLAVLHLDDASASIMAIPGLNYAKVAYHPGLDTALVLSERSVTWLDGAGNVLDRSLLGMFLNEPDLMVTREGFLGLLPDNGSAGSFLMYAAIGSTPEAPRWQALVSGGPFLAKHSQDDLGYARWIAVDSDSGPDHRLFEVATPAPQQVRTLDAGLPLGNGRFVALFEDGGRTYGIFGGPLPRSHLEWGMWLVDVTEPDAVFWRLDRSPNGPDAAVLRLGSDWILASSAIHPDYRMSIAQLRPGQEEPLGTLRVLADSASLSRSASLTRTPKGFAAAWWEGTSPGESIRIQRFDCCLR